MTWRKCLAVLLATPVLLVAGYIAFLWVSYISETTSSGSAYGFSVGSTKAESAAAFTRFRQQHPEAVVYVSYGHRAGDHFTVPASVTQRDLLVPHDQWNILIDGHKQFWNVVRLNFEGDTLVSIYRHRQYFELP